MPLYDGLVKLDHLNDDVVVAHVALGAHLSCGECSFVPKKSESAMTNEDDGYLVVFVSDDRTPDTTELWIFCARSLSSASKPLTRIILPQRVPYGFHGNWIDENELEHVGGGAGLVSRL